LGGALQVRKPITPFLSANAEYRLEQIKIYNLTGNYGDAIAAAGAYSPYTKSAILLGLNYDNRDSLLLTRRGFSVDATGFIAGGGLGGSVQDYGLTLGVKKFTPLPWDMILLTKGAVGSVASWGGGTPGTYNNQQPPIFDELYLGGANDMRGFAFREVGPKDQYGNPIGGSTSVYGTIELSMPVIPRVRFALFSDWGWVNYNSWDLSPQQYTAPVTVPPNSYNTGGYNSYTSGGVNGDVGIGARLELPIGPIRIDWGYPVMSDQWNHSNGQFNFNVGYTF
jgi:outer membrane protein insertion porin family